MRQRVLQLAMCIEFCESFTQFLCLEVLLVHASGVDSRIAEWMRRYQSIMRLNML